MYLLCMRWSTMRMEQFAYRLQVYDDIPVKIKKQVQVDLTNSTYPEAPVIAFYQGYAG